MRGHGILLMFLVFAVACGGPEVEEIEMNVDEDGLPQVSASIGSPEEIVLAELNETCEENWCYGEFEYEFLALECEEGTCELFFRADSERETFEGSVVFEYDQPLVDGDYLEAGNWERVNDAITDWEAVQDGS